MVKKVIENVAWMNGAEEVPSVRFDQITENEFKKQYVDKNLPLIIRGAIEHWPAMKKWKDAEYLKGICPGQKAYFYPHSNYMRKADQQVGEEVIEFAEGVDRLNSAASDVMSMLLTINKPFSPKVGLFLELLRDFDGFHFLKTHKSSSRFAEMRAFFYRGAETSWHHHYCDETLLCQVVGGKTIGLLFADNVAQKKVGYKLEKEFYLNDPSVFKKEDASGLRPMIAEIEEGDALYIPAFWWHGVSPMCHGQFGISVAKTWNTPPHLLGNFMLPGPRILWWASFLSRDRLAVVMPLMTLLSMAHWVMRKLKLK